MKTYLVKENGFAIGQARGKDNAVKMLKKHLEWDGISDAEWHTRPDKIVAVTDNNVYTIEKSS